MPVSARYARPVSPASRRLPGAVIITVLFVFAIGTVPASAGEPLAIIDETVIVAKPGSTTNLVEVAVQPEHVGSLCTIQVHSQNQASVHPGNDLVITTGDTMTVIEDVEAKPDEGHDLSAEVVLGATISVDLRMGSDWMSSLGFELDLDCGTTAPILVKGASQTTAPEPLVEVATTVPGISDPCSGADDGSLSLDGDRCGPEVAATAAIPPTTTTTVAPSTSAPSAAVLGVTVENLPHSPSAVAVAAAPAYTG